MEEKRKRIERKMRLAKFRIGMFEELRVEVEGNLGAIEKTLNAEEENLEQLKAEAEDRLWAQAMKAGKTPNYKIDEIEQQRLLKEAEAKQALL